MNPTKLPPSSLTDSRAFPCFYMNGEIVEVLLRRFSQHPNFVAINLLYCDYTMTTPTAVLIEVRHVAATSEIEGHEFVAGQSNNDALWFPFENGFIISCDGTIIATGERNIKTLADIKVRDVVLVPTESKRPYIFVQSGSIS